TVKSAGTGPDNVKAAATTDINVSHLATSGSVLTAGGKNVTVNTAAGNVTVGSVSTANVNPVGAVNVTAANNGNVTVFGGTTVTVNDAGQNSTIQIGTNGSAVSASEPTGAVTVNATGTGSTVDVYGGTDVTVTSAGGNSDQNGYVQVGDIENNVVYAPTGNVTVNVNQAQAEQFNFGTGDYTGYYGEVDILGGANVSVTTNAGSVYVGGTSTNNGALIAGQNPTGTVTVTDTAGAEDIEIYGGTDVNVTAAGDYVTIGNVNGSIVAAPSGTVTVNNTASVAFNGINGINNYNAYVNVVGGTNVDITTNAGSVTVGTAAGTAGSEATGTINVTDSSSGNVSVYGGTDVTVSAAGGTVIVGSDNAGASATGDVSVTQSAVETGGQFASRSAVNVVGGDNVTVNTTGGNVSVGSAAAPTTGAVVINDTFVGPNVDGFTVVGGTTVSINTTATSGSINVGNVTADIDSVTGALKNASDYASGNVTIVNESKAGTSAAGASNVYGTGSVNVGTDGATSVSITGGTNAVITDIQTELSKGVSTLSNVSLDHVEGNVSINSDALTSLTVLNGSIGGAVYTVNNATAGHDLALTLGGDAVNSSLFLFDTVADATAGAVTVADNGVASGAVLLDVTAAKSITVNTTAALTLGVDAGSDLTSVTLNNSAALNLTYSPGATNLASINASAATGAVTVAIDSTVTSFTGGAGNDVVTIDSNSLLHADETTYSTISGGAGNNTLVANYVAQTTDTALGSNAHITGFSTLALGDSAKSDSHTGSVYVAGVPAVTAVAQVSNLTFSQGHDYNVSNVVGESISVTITVGVTPHVISYDITGDTTVQNVAAGLAGAILAAGLTGFSVALQTGAIVITGPSDGTAFTISNTTLTNADPTDIDATATTPTPAVLGSAGTPADASYDASGFTALQVGQTAGDVAFTKVAAGTTLDVTASQGGASIVNYLL
ncbi:beta strand repeat-containing protein, partial [Paraburkholderia unamae]|uniref:beta strand repeat-containing protein n=1 Tax=Paraburkholderia unamae TaxID=219649 RepID=UPI003FD8B6CC